MSNDAWKERLYAVLGGAACRRCSFSDRRALQIDHVDGNGNSHRKEYPIGSTRFYRYVEEHPAEFQILCANCNWIKRSENREVVHYTPELRARLSASLKHSWSQTRDKRVTALREAWADPIIRAARLEATRNGGGWSNLRPGAEAGKVGSLKRWAQPGARERQADAVRAAAARGAYRGNGDASRLPNSH